MNQNPMGNGSNRQSRRGFGGGLRLLVVGAMLAYFALSQLTEWIPTLLGLGAASMIYVAVADLIPGLHKRTDLRATIQQVLLIGLGVGSIALVRALAGE